MILVINYFDSSLDHSLINPNQICAYGIPVSDNPFDSDRPFGINHGNMFISFKTEGSAVYFETSVPSDDDLESCLFLTLTHDDID